ncbi:SDR family NAD(P)-dependent oxidoreductase [Kingella kingae]|uniref:SDR family NAD(P)-dependent oxidoreductase n=1 Tax=Kingella kingae TaxID=504 RepID=UPI00041EDB5A|nr:SDR family NAD(P)-dependent oxidoreductase [Kingella kingae]MDK4625152.1 SDR family NAD(P)-dependent oxidoreductase [Kingella kingae]MDK4660845.1 SDR family NAD(P)-dependent oxidoreductase [Kingella kingae]MDK4668785.1 SDR family NAD(P)-dependent oxidoreductase [Kingella kingae]MDK4686880.1 SDR family NAD(P)-dependent oxidoreductase [Kingella kingae]
MAILITGASVGFGAAMATAFVQAGYLVIGTARRSDKLAELKAKLGDRFQPITMDVCDKNSMQAALAHIQTLPEAFRQIDCLINNAGLALGLDKAYEANFDDWETMIHTNIIGLTYLTRQVLPQMVANQRGYIINIGSIAGNYVYPGSNVYGASKAYVRQFSHNLRADLHGTGVRVSNVEPGLVGGSEFSNVRFKGDNDRAAQLYENANALMPNDIAQTVLWLYQTPAHMNVNSIEVMPTTQSWAALNVYKGEAAPDNAAQTEVSNPSDANAPELKLFSKLAQWFK